MRIAPKIFLFVALGLAVAACANNAKQGGGSKKGGGGTATDDGEGEGDGTGDAVKLSGDADFDGWCEKAGETGVAKDELQDLYGDFCKDGKASSTFKSTLLTVVYNGSGEPKLKSLEKMTSDKSTKTTTYKFGVAIKLPISIQTHFDKVGPRAGDEESQKELAEANGATAEIEVKKEYKNDGEHHVRGWLIYSKNVKKAGAIKITTETEGRSDQFELEESKLYMYTQNTLKGIQTVKKFDMMTAGIQDGNDAYLLTIVDVAVNNKGFASEAEKQLKKTATDTIKAMYKAAADAE